MEVGHIMLDGDPAPPQKTEHSPQFSVHVYCGQTAGWIKMPLGTNVGLGPCHIVLDWNPSPPPPERGTAAPPLFSAHVYCGHGRPSQLLLSSCYCMLLGVLRYCMCAAYCLQVNLSALEVRFMMKRYTNPRLHVCCITVTYWNEWWSGPGGIEACHQ